MTSLASTASAHSCPYLVFFSGIPLCLFYIHTNFSTQHTSVYAQQSDTETMTSDDAAATRAANPYLDLPAELHRIINPYVSHVAHLDCFWLTLLQIPRPSDLKALCLACKEMRVVAVEFLYRYFEISLDRYTVSRYRTPLWRAQYRREKHSRVARPKLPQRRIN